jgi:ppGpp synthetase/RelA/SpoT-type nucleotidyltranferase
VGVTADRWLVAYTAEYEQYKAAAKEIQGQIADALNGNSLNIHLIEARAKTPDSVAEKIERRGYGRPAIQFDDLLGARVITLFDHSVADTVGKLKARFEVDEQRSTNKTAKLRLRQVGYRSHHLVLKARATGMTPVAQVLRKTFVEVQVRSVISHAWAEIEHSLRYKIGDGIPNDLARRFDALAGTLELVDREFSGIEEATVELVRGKASRYRSNDDLHDALSTVQLLAALMCSRPNMKSLGPDGLPLPIEEAFKFAKILVRCGIPDVSTLMHALDGRETSAIVRRYTESTGFPLEPDEASGIVVVGAIVGQQDLQMFKKVDAFSDSLLLEALT